MLARRPTLLVVDDSRFKATTVAGIVTQPRTLMVEICMATSIDEAAELIRQGIDHMFAAIFDYNFLGDDRTGLVLAQEVRKISRRTAIALLTGSEGSDLDRIRLEAPKNGVDEVYSYPNQLLLLRRWVREIYEAKAHGTLGA